MHLIIKLKKMLKRMKYLILIIFIICYQVSLFSQNQQATLKGYIIDDNGPIAFANITIMNTDSVLQLGIISSNDGSFELNDVSFGDKVMQVSFLGYQKKQVPIHVDSSDMSLGLIKLNPSTIDIKEINVKGNTSVFFVKNDRLITNVSNSSLSTIGNAKDVLDKLPSVFVKDEEIEVFGKGTPSIYINNRKVYDISELDDFDSQRIKSIEVIHNPGAKYDAEEQSVIVIKTKDNVNGFSAKILEQTKIGKYLSDKETIDLSYNSNNLNVSTSYTHSYARTKWIEEETYTIDSDTLWNQYIYSPGKAKFKLNKFKESIDYTINENNTLGLRYLGFFSSIARNLGGYDDVYADGNLYDYVAVESLVKTKPNKQLLNLSYDTKLNDQLSFNLYADYFNTQSTTDQSTEEISQEDDQYVLVNTESNYDMYAIKGIFNYNADNYGTFDFGQEIIRTDGNGYYENSLYSSYNSQYKSKEENYATFISYSNKLKSNLNIKAGIRYEKRIQYYKDVIDNEVDVDREDNKFYPNFSLSYHTNRLSMSLSAGIRAKRPSFANLNGNNVYVNQFLYQAGNSNLKQQEIYSIDYKLGYSFLNLSLGYIYNKNPFSSTIIENSSSSSSSTSILTYDNYKSCQNLNALITLKHSFNFYEPQLTTSISKPIFKANYNGEMLDRNKPSIAINFYNNFNLPKDYILSLDFNYQNSFDSYIKRIEGYKELDIRLRKSFFDKKLSVNISIQDVFDWVESKSIKKIDDYTFVQHAKRETQYIDFRIAYSFNNFKNTYKDKHVSSSELNRF